MSFWLICGLGLAGALLLGLSLSLMAMNRKLKAMEVSQAAFAKRMNRSLKILKNEQNALWRTSAGMGNRLTEMQERKKREADYSQVIMARKTEPKNYKIARKLMSLGASIADISEHSGLSNKEIQYLCQLPGKKEIN